MSADGETVEQKEIDGALDNLSVLGPAPLEKMQQQLSEDCPVIIEAARDILRRIIRKEVFSPTSAALAARGLDTMLGNPFTHMDNLALIAGELRADKEKGCF